MAVRDPLQSAVPRRELGVTATKVVHPEIADRDQALLVVTGGRQRRRSALADRFARRSVNSPISAFRPRGSMNGFTELPPLPDECWLCRSCPWRRPAPGTFGRSPGGRAANRDVHPWFASNSPLEGGALKYQRQSVRAKLRSRQRSNCTAPRSAARGCRHCRMLGLASRRGKRLATAMN